MYKMMSLLSALFFSTVLSACATTTAANGADGESGTSVTAKTPASGLPPQRLLSGECALFVWTADREKRFILYSRSDQAQALWAHGDVMKRPKRIDEQGIIANEQAPIQSFSVSDGTLDMILREPEPRDNGTGYGSGTLTFIQADGWEQITPIIGASACKN